MSFAGESHFFLVGGMGVWIAIVFVIVARWTRASRRAVLGAVAGGLCAGAVNMATDAAAYNAGYWRYVEVTTPFGPLLYYCEAGLGCGALALVMLWMRAHGGLRTQLMFLGAFAVYGPIRDWATAHLTNLIAFHYEPMVVVVIADALSSFVVPMLVAYGVISLFVREEQPTR